MASQDRHVVHRAVDEPRVVVVADLPGVDPHDLVGGPGHSFGPVGGGFGRRFFGKRLRLKCFQKRRLVVGGGR